MCFHAGQQCDVHQAIDPGLNSALTGLGSAKLNIKARLMLLEGVSSFGFGGTNGRCDIWGAARLIPVGSACLVRWKIEAPLRYRFGRFGPNKCGKVMEAEVDQIYTLCLGPGSTVEPQQRSMGPVIPTSLCYVGCNQLPWSMTKVGFPQTGRSSHVGQD